LSHESLGFFLARRSIATVDRKTQIVWPDAARRAELAGVYRGILRGMVGVTDVREHEVDKSKNKEGKKKTWSGKKES